MSNQLSHLLSVWQADQSGLDWVLGTVYRTEGSAYRKAGAMMLINSLGQQFGLLSGGCLESDIVRNARKVMLSGQSVTLIYDGSDEDDLSFQLGIGCGGKVYIMLQPISQDNDLDLPTVTEALTRRRPGTYYQKIGGSEAYFKADETRYLPRSVIEKGWLVTSIRPEPHLLVVGGGVDARPVVAMAKELGWRVSLADPRPANARGEFFPRADAILKKPLDTLSDYARTADVNIAILMSHNVNMDAEALKQLHNAGLIHIAQLGPRHRYRQVLERAGLNESRLGCPVSGPAGLEIGGQLPESIALSILAECHAVLHWQLEHPLRQVAAR